VVMVENIESRATVALGDGTNSVQAKSIDGTAPDQGVVITLGDGNDNVMTVGENNAGTVTNADITFGDGDGQVFRSGDVTNSTITMGDGDSNEISIDGNFNGGLATTINLGSGDSATVRIEGGMYDETLNGGNATGVDLTVKDDVRSSEITLGLHSAAKLGGVHESNITFGEGNDQLTVGRVFELNASIAGASVQTNIDMGAGDDDVTLWDLKDDTSNNPSPKAIVSSGASLDGGDGYADSLFIASANDITLVERTAAQVVVLSFSGSDAEGDANFTVGSTVSVTVAGVVYSYVVQASDIVQGDGATTAARVAAGLKAVLGDNVPDGLGNDIAVTYDSHVNKITLTGTIGAPDVEIAVTAQGGGSVEADVTQIADAGIAGFERLHLSTDGDLAEQTVNVDFDLVDGVFSIDLDAVNSGRESYVIWPEYNGSYTEVTDGTTKRFELENLNGTEVISVSADEASTSGNQQVDYLTIETDHQIGDVITLTLDGTEYSITITEQDLSGADAAADNEAIAQRLYQTIDATDVSVSLDLHEITFIGQPGEGFSIDFSHERFSNPVVDTLTAEELANGQVLFALPDASDIGDIVSIKFEDRDPVEITLTEEVIALLKSCLNRDELDATLQGLFGDDYTLEGETIIFDGATGADLIRPTVEQVSGSGLTSEQDHSSVDDTTIDVVVNATLAEDAADTVMYLRVDGEGAFDLEIDGGEDSSFTDLSLTLGDEHDHYIDLGNTFDESITVVDSVNADTSGSNIILDNVGAQTVTSTSAADMAINQLADGEVINVSTGDGDDYLRTSVLSALAEGSTIDLGTGANTLALYLDGGFTVEGVRNIIADASADEGEGDTDLGAIAAVQSESADAFTLTLGERVTGNIESPEDRDVFAVELEAGQMYQVGLHTAGDDRVWDEGELGDARLFAYDDQFNLLSGKFEDADRDDFGSSELGEARIFTAEYTGIHYFEVANYYEPDVDEPFGTYSIEVFETGNLLKGLDYSGDLDRLELDSLITLEDGAVASIVMPGVAGQVSEVYFDDVEVGNDGQASLTLAGTASDLTVISDSDFGVDKTQGGSDSGDRVTFEAVGVTNLTFDIDDEIHVDMRGSALETLTVDSGDDAQLFLDGDHLGSLSAIDVAADDNVEIEIENLATGASVLAASDANIGGSGTLELRIAHSSLGNVDASFGYEDDAADEDDVDLNGMVAISDTDDGAVTVGNVQLSVNEEFEWADSYQSAGIIIESNDGSTVVTGDLSVAAGGNDIVVIVDNDDSSVTVGNVDVTSSQHEAEFYVVDQDASQVSVGSVA
ncbi:hypothetical protein, partial [Marivita sp.]|uniref:hypothetical protein n=1 Tax=Marivita sp. TaxID=2003365 RepID=UPI0025BAC0D5